MASQNLEQRLTMKELALKSGLPSHLSNEYSIEEEGNTCIYLAKARGLQFDASAEYGLSIRGYASLAKYVPESNKALRFMGRSKSRLWHMKKDFFRSTFIDFYRMHDASFARLGYLEDLMQKLVEKGISMAEQDVARVFEPIDALLLDKYGIAKAIYDAHFGISKGEKSHIEIMEIIKSTKAETAMIAKLNAIKEAKMRKLGVLPPASDDSSKKPN